MAILPRYKRMQRRDWKDPFSWFNWFQMKKDEVPLLYSFQGGVDPRYGLSSFPAGTYSGASVKTYVDGSGVVQYAPMNLALRSEALNTSPWTRTATVTEGAAYGAGISLCRVAGVAGKSIVQTVTFTADGVKAYSAYVKSDGADGFAYLLIYDSSAPATRGLVKFTVASGVVTAAATTGTLVSCALVSDGVYRITAYTTSVTAANTNLFYLFDPVGDATLTTVLIGGVQAENNPVPTTYQPTTTTAVYAPRYQHVDPSNPSLGQLLLLEGSRTNKVVQSQSIAAASGWTAEASCSQTLSQTDPANGTNATLLTASGVGSNYYRTVSFTGDGTKVMQVCIKQGSGSVPEFGVLDDTSSTWRHRVRATWSAGVPTLSTVAGSGTLFTPKPLANGYYLCSATVASITAANDNRLKLFPSVPAGSDTAYFAFPQVEDATFPSSYIPTTTTAVTRAADSLSFEFLPVPQAMTVYADFVEGGAINYSGTAGYVMAIPGATNPTTNFFLMASNGAGKYRTNLSGRASTAAAAPTIGQRVELRGLLIGDGSSQLGQSIAGAAEVVASASGTGSIPAAYDGATIGLGYAGAGTDSFLALRSLKIASGVRSLDTMRSL